MRTHDAVHVVLVEDDPGDARLIRELLAGVVDAEYELTHVMSIADAVRRLGEHRADVLLVDLGLPDGTGLDTVVQLSRHQPEVPVVVMTGNDDQALAIDAVRNGVQDYLVKGRPSAQSIARVIRYAMERKRNERLERDRNSLQEAVRSMKQVLGVVGHELRTPLTAIRATTEFLLTENVEEDALRRSFLRGLHDSVLRLTNMVNDMLEAARLQSGEARWRWRRRIPIEDVCRLALDELRPLVETTTVRLESSVQPSDLSMNGDADALRRLLLNLVFNAHKHTTEGSIRIHARGGGADVAGEWVRLEVTDTGEGIPPGIVEHLGRPFVLNSGVAGADDRRGAGLGIAICKGIVSVHGGSMSIRSTEGEGTTVVLRLRADLDEPAPIQEDPMAESQAPPRARTIK